MNRRDLLKGLAGSSAAVVAAAPLTAGARTPDADSADGLARDGGMPKPAQPDVDAPSPWSLVLPEIVGSELSDGWHLSALSPIIRGRFTATLMAGLREARVAVCARGEVPRGLAATDRTDLVLLNHGRGELATDETLARAIDVLADRIRANEQDADVLGLLRCATDRQGSIL